MEALSVRKEVVIEAPAVRVWPYVGTQAGWRRVLEAEHPLKSLDHLTLEEQVGGRFELRGVQEGKPFHIVGTVLAYEPPHRLVLTWREEMEDGALWPEETMVEETLIEEGSRTRLTVLHSGFERLPEELRREILSGYEAGWARGLEARRALALGDRSARSGANALIVHKEIEIDAPAERIWPFVATREGGLRWLCNVAEVHELLLEPRAGGRFEERMVVRGREYAHTGEILVYDPPQRFVFTSRPRRPDGSYWPVAGTVTITLTERGGRTLVTVEETGFDEFPVEEGERLFRSADGGWSASVADLRALLARELLPALGRVLILKEIEVDAPIERVWYYVGTEEGKRQWDAAAHPPGHTQMLVLEERAGGRFESRGIHNGSPFRIVGSVLRYEPPKLLTVTWREELDDGSLWPAETVVSYTLTEYFGRTRVTVEHAGFERLPQQYRERVLKAYEVGRTRSIKALPELLRQPAPRT